MTLDFIQGYIILLGTIMSNFSYIHAGTHSVWLVDWRGKYQKKLEKLFRLGFSDVPLMKSNDRLMEVQIMVRTATGAVRLVLCHPASGLCWLLEELICAPCWMAPFKKWLGAPADHLKESVHRLTDNL